MMTMLPETKFESDRDLIMLEKIEQNPDITQASLANQLGVAVGTVNWHIKRLIDKGYVKVKRAQRKKLKYIITPEGIAHRAQLTVHYIETSMRLYRRVRQRVRALINEVREAGYTQVLIDGDGDIADICRLTCLKQNIKSEHLSEFLAAEKSENRQVAAPVLEIHGTRVLLHMEALQNE